MKKIYLLVYLLFFSIPVLGQSFYVSISSGTVLERITPTAKGYTANVMNTGPGHFFYSIAVFEDKLYFVDGNSIFVGDINGDSIFNIQQLCVMQGFFSPNALTISKTGVLYFASGNNLGSIDSRNPTTVFLGQMPYSASGDLAFYKNELYMASYGGIVKVNINAPGQSIMYLPLSNSGIFGLTTVTASKYQNKVYALAQSVNNNTDIIELDMGNRVSKGVVGTLTGIVYDAASDSEDGAIDGIKIDSINVHQDCDLPTKGILQINCESHSDVFTYTLSNGISNTTGYFNNVAPGNYDIHITSAQDTKDTTVVVPVYTLEKPDVSYSTKHAVCDVTGQIILNTTANSDLYRIKFQSNVFPFDHIFTGLSAGLYHFDILNKSGCIVDTLSVNLVRDRCLIGIDSITVSKECTDIKKGQIKVYTKMHGDTYSYALSNGLTNSNGTFNNISPGTYSLKITSAEDKRDTTVNVPDFSLSKPVFTAIQVNEVCDQKGTVSFTTPGNGNQYSIKSGSDTFPFNHLFIGLAKGTYHYTILNSTGCVIDTQSVNIQRDLCRIKIDSILINKQCSDVGKGQVRVYNQLHGDQYTYTLSNGLSNSNGIFDHIDPGVYVLKLTSSEDQKDTTITVPDYSLSKPIFTYTVKNQVCDQNGTVSFVTPVNGNLYSVKSGSDIFPLNHLFTGLVKGIYHYTMLDNKGCTVDTISVRVNYFPCSIDIDSIQVSRQCSTYGKDAISVANRMPAGITYTYILNNSITNTSGIFNDLSPGSYAITIKSSENITKDTLIQLPDFTLTKPVFVAVSTDENCDDKGAVAFHTPANSNLYSIQMDNSVFPLSHVFTNLIAGTYHFSITNKNGCIIDTLSAVVKRTACRVQFDSIGIHKECGDVRKAGIQIYGVLHSTATLTYILNGGQANTTGIFANLDPGSYSLTVRTSENVSKDTTVTIPDYYLARPRVTFQSTNPVCDILGRIQLTIKGDAGEIYKVQFHSTTYPSDHVFKGLSAGDHQFSIIKQNGCLVDTLTITLNKESCNPVVFSNAFTPNGDGQNDVFGASQDSKAVKYQLLIYNRMGGLVYSSADLHQGWDGRFNGKDMPVGVYYWVANYTDQNNKPITQSGYVTLLR